MSLAIPSWKRNYYLFQAANFITIVCDFLASISLHWWVLEHSNGLSELSSIFLTANVIRLVALPLLGPIGDRFDRRNILNSADTVSCIVTIILALFVYHDHVNVLALCLLTIVSSLAGSLFRAGSAGFFSEIIPREHYPWAIAQNQIMVTIALILGGSIGAAIVSLIGSFWSIIINAAAIIVALILIRLIRFSKTPIVRPHYTIGEWKSDFVSGLRFVIDNKNILTALLIAVAMNALLTPFDLLLPYYVQKVNLGSVRDLGLIEASIAVGSIAGSFLFSNKHLKKNVLVTTFAAIIVISISLALFGFFANNYFLFFFGALFGMGQILFFLPARINLMVALPDDIRSRVGVIFTFGQQIGKPLAIMLTTVAVNKFAVSTILTSIAVLLLAVIPIMMLMPSYLEFLTGHPHQSPSDA